ncbi:MAG: hypothetical protein CML56_01045 [Rhodobacteraceae bacterium]|nr:hypothetical protein [Paracoccaceae bacterium]
MNMLHVMYRAMVIGRARSAAEQIARNMSDRQLKDIGYTRYDIVQSAVESVTKELEEKRQKRLQQAITPPSIFSLSTIWAFFMNRTAS